MSRAKAIYKFEATQPGDLSFEVGEVIIVLQQNDSGWWTGQKQDGRQGLFPYNRVKLLTDKGTNGTPLLGASPEPLTSKVVVDRLNRITVQPSEEKMNNEQAYVVELEISSGQNVSGRKTMKDFRVLSSAMNFLSGAKTNNGSFYRKNATVEETQQQQQYDLRSPEWADSVFLDKAQIIYRAAQLQKVLEEAHGEPSYDYLMVYFLNPNMSYSLGEKEKRTVAEVYRQAQKDVIERKGSKAVPLLARAAYDWVQRDEQEVNLVKNEIIAVLEQNTMYTGWWMAEKINGHKGVFPYNYVQVLPPNVAQDIVNLSSSPSVTPRSPVMETTKQPFENVSPSAVRPNMNNGSANGRNRKRITKYSLCSTEAFDELLQHGSTTEENGQLAKFQGRVKTPKNGDVVRLLYSGYIWEPQKQELLEFASSDVLLGGSSGKVSTGPLEFVIGKEEAIEGIEETVKRMEEGQTVRVTLTPAMGYGDIGYPPDIPGNAYLVYDITLEEIRKNAESVRPNQTGVAKSTVLDRKVEGTLKDFKGFNSIKELKQQSQQTSILLSQQRIEKLTGQHSVILPTNFAGTDSEANKKKLSLIKIQEIVRKRQYEEYGINPAIIEEYLTDEEFKKAFNVDHFTWLLMPAYKRKQMKQQVQLF